MRNGHFCLITDLSAVCSKQINKHKSKKFICDRYLSKFTFEEKLISHLVDCSQFDSVKINLPTQPNNKLKFSSFAKQIKSPLIIYGDFECLTTKIDNTSIPVNASSSSSSSSPYTIPYQKHIPFSVAFHTVCSVDPTINYFELYRGIDPEKWFVKKLQDIAQSFVDRILTRNLPMNPLCSDKLKQQNEVLRCMNCSMLFCSENPKVAHHCHITGHFISTLCRNCNLQFKRNNVIHFFFHNSSGYDAHLIIKALSSIEGHLSVIPISQEKYISFTKSITVRNSTTVRLRFLDSYRFVSSSLDALSRSLSKNDFVYSKAIFPDDLSLVIRKGVFPYDYVDSIDKLNATRLP